MTTTTDTTTTTGTRTVTAAGYTATLDHTTGTVRITDADGHWAGDGRWDGARIVDCAADLGDATYDALDAALTAQGA